EYLTDRLAAEAEKFIEANKDRPFFLYLPHYAPHTPLRAKPGIQAKYKVTPKAGTQSNPAYAAMVESLDEAVGRVLKKLDELTLVMSPSDNGGLATTEGGPTGATFNGPLREGKGFLYEGGVRVPLIVKWPGVVKPGTVTGYVASSVDLFPTILAAVGHPVPKGDRERLDGDDLLLRALRGEQVVQNRVYWHYPHYSNQGGKPGGAIRIEDHKLIEWYEDGRLELYNVRADPSESRNLIAEKKALAELLHHGLKTWRKDVGAKMPTPNP